MGAPAQAPPLQLPSWWDYAKQLPEDIPDTAYDAQRQDFFEKNILPAALREGEHTEEAWQTFKHFTERPGKNPAAGLSHFATTAIKSAADPILGIAAEHPAIATAIGGPVLGALGASGKAAEWKKGLEEMTQETREELQKQGKDVTVPLLGELHEAAGTAVGMAPYFAPGMQGAEAASAALKLGRVGGALMEGLAGGVTQGAYDAAKAQDGHRIEEGLTGAVTGGALFTAGGLLGSVFRKHPDLPKPLAQAVVKNATTAASPEDAALAKVAEQMSPGVAQTVADATTEQVKAADRNGVPVEVPKIEKSNGYVRIKIQGADGKTYNIGGGKGVNVSDWLTFNTVVSRIAQHMEGGGKIISEVADPNTLLALHKALERINGERGEYGTPLNLKGSPPGPNEPTLLHPSDDLLPTPPKAGAQSPAATPLEGVEPQEKLASTPGVAPPSEPEEEYSLPVRENIEGWKQVLSDPYMPRIARVQAKEELFRISPKALEEVEAGLPLAVGETSLDPKDWREMLRQEAQENAPELAARGLTLDDVPEYDKLEQLPDGSVVDHESGKMYSDKVEALKDKGLLRYSIDMDKPGQQKNIEALRSAEGLSGWTSPQGEHYNLAGAGDAGHEEFIKSLRGGKSATDALKAGWIRVTGADGIQVGNLDKVDRDVLRAIVENTAEKHAQQFQHYVGVSKELRLGDPTRDTDIHIGKPYHQGSTIWVDVGGTYNKPAWSGEYNIDELRENNYDLKVTRPLDEKGKRPKFSVGDPTKPPKDPLAAAKEIIESKEGKALQKEWDEENPPDSPFGYDPEISKYHQTPLDWDLYKADSEYRNEFHAIEAAKLDPRARYYALVKAQQDATQRAGFPALDPDKLPKASIDAEDKPAGEDIIRGSTEVPLSEHGQEQTKELGRQLAARGGLDDIISSSKGRAIQTMANIQEGGGARNISGTEKSLEPMYWGALEGRATREVLDTMHDYMLNRPDEAYPGMGAQSQEPGESFNDFRTDTLRWVADKLDKFAANPEQKQGWVTHYRDIKLIQAWLKNGMPDDLSIDTEEMLRKDGSPASVYHLAPDDTGRWSMERIDPSDMDPLQPGYYVIRHGNTAWNGENPGGGGAGTSVSPSAGNVPVEQSVYKGAPGTIEHIRPIGYSMVASQPPPGQGVPDQAAAATFGTPPGIPPVYWYSAIDREDITHEGMHGMIKYFGDSLIPLAEKTDGMTFRFAKIFQKNKDLAAVYKDSEIPEESYAYLAQAVRHDNEKLLAKFIRADHDKETVLKWLADRTASFQAALASAPESVLKRVSQRRLGDILRRSTGSLDAVGRDNIQIAGGDVNFDSGTGEHLVEHPDGSTAHFSTRNDAADYLEKMYAEPLSSRNLVDSSALPEGVPRFAVDTKPFTTEKAPIGTNPPSPEASFGGRKSEPGMRKIQPGLPSYGELKPDLGLISNWITPFYPWVNRLAERNSWPELSTRAGAVKDAEVSMQGAIDKFVLPLRDMMKTFDHARQRDVYKFFEAKTDAARQDVFRNAKFSDEEMDAINNFEKDFVEPAKEALGVDVRDYMRTWAPKWRKLGDDIDSLGPRYSDTIEGPFQFMAKAVRNGELDPRDENMARVAAAYLHSGMRKQYLEEPLNEFAALNNLKTPDDKYVTGSFQPLLKRQIEYMRGVPDSTQAIVDATINKFKDIYNTGVDIANQHLPERFQLDKLDDPPRTILGKWILYQYAGGLALRPMVPIRDAMQLFITTLPVLGEKYMWKGMERAFGPQGVISLGRDSDAYQTALKYGSLLRKNDLYKAISGEDAAKLGKYSEGALAWLQHAHNSNRLVAHWGHFEKAMDAADNPDTFAKNAGLHWLDGPTRDKFLQEFQTKGMSEDLGHKIAKEMVDVSQWNYSRGAQPGIHKYALGRLFGQYGIYPLNYIDFARRLATSGELSDKALALTRLTLAHGAIIKAGEVAGIDTAHWVFTQPMAYGGGPLFQSVTHIPGSMDFESKRGDEARASVIRPIWPMGAPGGLEAYNLYKSIVNDDPDKWKIILGFQPLKAGEENKGWHGIM